ncbi:unnamed protein product, partial [Enterobius vermicularis]|uniref:Thyrotropin-releasing hormone receptor n=1 Tax=Enterobius vermicularis TaxID=51028 RepID=A0A0N4V9C9_ENTVE
VQYSSNCITHLTDFRYIAIVYPIHARRLCSVKNMIVAVIFMWICVFLIPLPNAIYNRIEATKEHEGIRLMACSNRSIQSTFWYIYKWVEFLSFYLIPCIIIVALYCRISRVLWSKNDHLQEGKIDLLLFFSTLTCSACNPLLYTLFSKKFRSKIFGLLACRKQESRRVRSDITNSTIRIRVTAMNEKERFLNNGTKASR